jgi:hypothetical protein
MDILSTVFKFPASFSDMLHSRYIIALHLYQVTLNFEGETCFAHKTESRYELLSWDQVSSVALAHQIVS